MELRALGARATVRIVVAALLIAVLIGALWARAAFLTFALRLSATLLTIEATILHERLGASGERLWLALLGLRGRSVLLLLFEG